MDNPELQLHETNRFAFNNFLKNAKAEMNIPSPKPIIAVSDPFANNVCRQITIKQNV